MAYKDPKPIRLFQRDKRRRELIGKTITQDSPDASQYPILSELFDRWEIQNYSYGFGDEGADLLNMIEERQSTFRITRATGVTDIRVFRPDGSIMPMGEFFKRTGFNVEGWDDPQTGKRSSRLFRKSYAFGAFAREDVPVATFREGFKDQWDGMNVISEQLRDTLIAHLPPETQERYRRAKRFEITAMLPYQVKGHAMVWSQEQMDKAFGAGVQFAYPEGSDKRQISYKPGGNDYFFDIRPVVGHNYVVADVQTITNAYRYFIKNEQFEGWLAKSAGKLLTGLKRGKFERTFAEMLFSDPLDEEAFRSKVEKMPVYEYLSSGGNLKHSPSLLRQLLNMFSRKTQGDFDKMRFPVEGGARLYMSTVQAAPDRRIARSLKAGQAYLDFDAGSVYLHDDDIKRTLGILGGGDQDDPVNILVNKRGQLLLTRQPNMQGEYVILNAANQMSDFDRHGVVPQDYDFSPLQGVTQFDEKRFKFAGGLPELPRPANITDFRSYSNWLMRSAASRISLLGQYINTLSAATMVFGKEPVEQIAAGEEVIDASQKNLSLDTSPVTGWMTKMALKLSKLPLPKDAQRRLRGVLRGKVKNFKDAPGHWMDDLQRRSEQVALNMKREVEGLASIASPPVHVLEQIEGDQLGRMLYNDYYEALHGSAKASRRSKPIDEDYEAADRTIASILSGLDEENRTQAVLQALLHPVDAEQRMNDKFMFGDAVKPYTFDAMRKAGWIGEPEQEIPEEAASRFWEISMMSQDAWHYAAMNKYGKPWSLLSAQEQKKIQEQLSSDEFLQGLVGRSIDIVEGPNPHDPEETTQLIRTDKGRIVGRVAEGHRGALSRLRGGVIAKASVRHGELNYAIANPRFEQDPEQVASKERINAVSANPFEFARKWIAGEETIEDLPSDLKETIKYAASRIEMDKQVAEGKLVQHEWSDNELARLIANRSLVRHMTSLKEQGQGIPVSEATKAWQRAYFGVSEGLRSKSWQRGQPYYDPLRKEFISYDDLVGEIGGEWREDVRKLGLYKQRMKLSDKQMWSQVDAPVSDVGNPVAKKPTAAEKVTQTPAIVQAVKKAAQAPEPPAHLDDLLALAPVGSSDLVEEPGALDVSGLVPPEEPPPFIDDGAPVAPPPPPDVPPWDIAAPAKGRATSIAAPVAPPPPAPPPAAPPPPVPPPPPEPPDDPSLPDDIPEDEPSEPSSTVSSPYWSETKARIRDIVRNRGSHLVKAQTGKGKTSMMVTAMGTAGERVGGGVGVIISPFSKVNIQNASAFNRELSSGIVDPVTGEEIHPQNAFYLPGHPGVGASPEKLAEYERTHREFYEALGVTFDEFGRFGVVNRQDPNTGEMVPAGRLRREGDKWTWAGDPLSIHLSPEKFVASSGTRLGKVLSFLAKNDLISFVGVDEAHDLLSASRYMGRRMPEAMREFGIKAPIGLYSGSISGEGIHALQNAFNIDPESTLVLPYEHSERVKWGLSLAPDRDAPRAIAASLEGDAPAMVFPARIDQIAPTVEAIGQRAFPFHADKNRPLPAEAVEFATKKIEGGFSPGDVGVFSSAVGTGVNRPEIGQAVVHNPFDMSDLLQKSGRVRDPRGGDPDRRKFIVADPMVYGRRAQKIGRTADRLSDPFYLTELFEHVRAGSYSENWQVAGTQMAASIGGRLSQDRLAYSMGSSALSYMQEAGLVRMELLGGEGEEPYMGWVFETQMGREEIAQKLSETRLKSRFIGEGGEFAMQSLRERVQEDAGLQKREQLAMQSMFSQIGYNAPGDADRFIKQAVTSYYQGGLRGLEDFVEVGLPTQLAEKFADSVKVATEKFEQTASSLGEMNLSIDDYNDRMKEAVKVRDQEIEIARKHIAGNRTATALAQGMVAQQAASQAQIGQYQAASTSAQVTQFLTDSLAAGAPGGAPPIPSGPGGGGSGGRGGRQPFSWRTNMARAALAGLFMDRRIWMYTIGAELQRATQVGDWAMPVMGTGLEYGLSTSGFRNRFLAGQEFLAQGSFGQVGAIAELPYALSGSRYGENIARAISTARIGAGVAGFGLASGATLAMMGQVGPAIGVAAGGIILGGGLAVGGGIAEGANAFFGFEGRDQITLDNSIRESALKLTLMKEFGLEGYFSRRVHRGAAPQGVTDYLEQLRLSNPRWYNFIMHQGTSPQEDRAREVAEDIATSVPGATAEQLSGLISRLGREMGGALPNADRFKAFYQTGSRLGYEPQEFSQTFLTLADQMGFRPGSFDYLQLMDQMTGAADPAAIAQMQADAGRFAGLTGQFSYFVGGYTAADIARTYGIDTPTKANALQGALAQYERMGVDLSQVLRTDMVEGRIRRTTAYRQPGKPAQIGLDWSRFRFGVPGSATVFEPAQPEQMITQSRFERTMIPKDFTVAHEIARQQDLFGVPVSNFVAGTFGQSMLAAGMSAPSVLQATEALGYVFQDYTQAQLDLAGQVMGGDLRAASYASYAHPDILTDLGRSVMGSRLYDMAGNPIYETSGGNFIGFLQAQAQAGNVAAQGATGFSPLFGTGMDKFQIAQSLGVRPNRMMAYMQGGTRAVASQIRSEMIDNQMASAGIQMAQVALQRQFYWGAGSWDAPAPGSMWFLEDRQRALQHRSTLASFASQEKRMELSRSQAITQEGLSERRMNLSQGFQLWQMGFERNVALAQRSFQDQTRGLQWGWQQEDFQEEARFLTGRERRKAERGMRRATVMHNLEGEQIDQMRSFEDERFTKQSEYAKKNMELDQEQFELTKKHREEMYSLEVEDFERRKKEYNEQKKIQDEMIQLQRKHQADMLALQAASAGLAAENLRLQKELEEVNRENNMVWSDTKGVMENINAYDQIIPIMKSIEQVLGTASNVDPAVMKDVKDALAAMSRFMGGDGPGLTVNVQLDGRVLQQIVINLLNKAVTK